MKTHKVLDLMYTVDEGQSCFSGTHQECAEFISEQAHSSSISMFKVVPMESWEINLANQTTLADKMFPQIPEKDSKKLIELIGDIFEKYPEEEAINLVADLLRRKQEALIKK